MKPGDQVAHKESGRILTVKRTGDGNGMVFCGWMEPKRGSTNGEQIECTAAFSWQELRAATLQDAAASIAAANNSAMGMPTEQEVASVVSHLNEHPEPTPVQWPKEPIADPAPVAAQSQQPAQETKRKR